MLGKRTEELGRQRRVRGLPVGVGEAAHKREWSLRAGVSWDGRGASMGAATRRRMAVLQQDGDGIGCV